MTASLLDGRQAASLLQETIKKTVLARTNQGHRPPGLAVILVGDEIASKIYVGNKHKACNDAGFNSYAYNLPADTSEKSLLNLIDELNAQDTIDGILVQLPLPKHISTALILERIDPRKDVDGFHPYNLGRLAQGNPLLRPCTPYGIIQLLAQYQLQVNGKHAVVVGASNIVGRPMALEFLLANATVTVCHRLTRELERHIRMAEILVVATGVMEVIDVAWLNRSQILIDVGIHRLPDGSIRGDVDFFKAKEKVAWITPVPGGVGPMTVCTLLQNTLSAAINLQSG
ncbi:bifunctional methylenetetrahydrofolate dehydrogenase/methenyltetrahydrofolate cyclohydrolase FolD [Legionella londiniensis]|uniref:Bifunctional protein FolD n=1 Tax=Legionella londiniensis TaxID=45068 RepID=A0A0W0VN21_9GAMM|nr:bifunctional methylenetetrahydrofolate dehydrogenase/methenyltetrahydrofolate cyclohydrolase FolD [Legionella londiniensis]KTD21554.1 methenyltetrahydrofolate cyclohydrolase/5,10-methylenetetrahydrofolate dehydrogenase (NADP+) [Legionella londiniensis]STX92769.1 methenyltetrahydrofolate cyclohydrolase [Legionella londiniensis]